MAVSYASGSIHFSGLGSDTDFDTMITQLKKLESIPKARMTLWRADWERRLGAFQELNTAIVDLCKKLNDINSVNKFMSKGAASSKETVATATVGTDADEGTHKLEVAQMAKAATFTSNQEFDNLKTVVNNTGATQNFTYIYKGKQHSVQVQDGCTLEFLVKIINNDQTNPGVRASLINSGGSYIFQLKGMDLGENSTLIIVSTGLSDFSPTAYTQGFTGKTDVVNSTGGNLDFSYTYQGATRTISVADGTTVEQLAAQINAHEESLGNPGVKASLAKSGNNVTFELRGLNGGTDMGLDVTAAPGFTGLTSQTIANNYYVQDSQNAKFKVNGFPPDPDKYLESTTNTVTGVIPDVTINIKDEGDTQITVTTDYGKIKENVVAVVEAVNALRTKILELTKVNDSKDPNNPDTATEQTGSNFLGQKGSLLTGNYGVQLIASNLKSVVASKAQGFEYLWTDKSGVTHGDLYSSLAQIGIMTVADTTSKDFGLLTFEDIKNKDGSYTTFDEILRKNPMEVAKLFAANGETYVDSGDFSLSGLIKGTTKAGNYNVKYEVDSGGNVINATIGGYKANYDTDTKQITALDGPAKGMALQIENFTAGNYSGKVTVKNGKIQEIYDTLEAAIAPKDPEGHGGGTLTILEANYKDIMKVADKKIDQEEQRLIVWERTIRKRFANLDAVLSTYNNQMKALEAAVKQLNSNSSTK